MSIERLPNSWGAGSRFKQRGQRMAESQSKAQEYRETAAKLREMADGMKSEDARAQLVELADQFDRLRSGPRADKLAQRG